VCFEQVVERGVRWSRLHREEVRGKTGKKDPLAVRCTRKQQGKKYRAIPCHHWVVTHLGVMSNLSQKHRTLMPRHPSQEIQTGTYHAILKKLGIKE
jgi:hypothetical protein